MKKWIFIPLLIILLVGFICMSLILIEGIGVIREITIKFINFMRGLSEILPCPRGSLNQ